MSAQTIEQRGVGLQRTGKRAGLSLAHSILLFSPVRRFSTAQLSRVRPRACDPCCHRFSSLLLSKYDVALEHG